MRKRAGAIVLLTALQGYAALPRDWPMFRGNPQQTGVAGSTLPDKPAELWKLEVKEPVVSTAAITGGRVYVGADDGVLYAIDQKTGAIVWKFQASEHIRSSPTVIENRVFFGDGGGTLHALEVSSGQSAWSFKTEGEIISSVNFSGKRLVFGSYDAHVYCLSADTGMLLWKHLTGGRVHGTPAISGGKVVAAGCDEFLHVLNLDDGSEAARIKLGSVSGASAAVSASLAFVGTYGNQVVAADLDQGVIAWTWQDPERQFPFLSSAAVMPSAVVIGGRDKRVHCFQPTSGTLQWSYVTKGRVDSCPVIVGDRVFVGSNDGNLYGIALGTGQEVFRFETGAPISASPAVGDGTLIVGNEDGFIYCLGEAAK